MPLNGAQLTSPFLAAMVELAGHARATRPAFYAMRWRAGLPRDAPAGYGAGTNHLVFSGGVIHNRLLRARLAFYLLILNCYFRSGYRRMTADCRLDRVRLPQHTVGYRMAAAPFIRRVNRCHS